MRGKPLNVLILDDSEQDALLLLRELGQQGFEVTWERACTANDTKLRLETRSWDVVLSDYSMGDFDAPAALRLLHESGHDLPFIVISGTVGEEAAVAAMRSGAHDYLMKGSLKRLGTALEREMREASIRREHRLAVEKVQHLNRVLGAIRNVNQLIVREKDPVRLIEEICKYLIEIRGYDASWIALINDRRETLAVAGRGYGDAWNALSEELMQAALPPCAMQALSASNAVFVEKPGSECADCIIHKSLGFHESLAMRLEHQGRVYGLMTVTFLGGIPVDGPETSLIEEVAGDIGFALWGLATEAERFRAKEFSESLIKTAQAIVLVLDPEGRIVLVNPYLEELSGRTLEEVRGENFFDIFLPEPRRSTARESFQLAINGDATRGSDAPLIARDGREFRIEWHTKTLKNSQGQTTGLLSIGQDVTARQEAAGRLKESEAHLANVINAIGDPIFVKDDAFRFVLVNKALCKLLGKSEHEVIGTTGVEFLPKEEMEHFLSVDQQVLSSGIENISEEPLTTQGGLKRTLVTKKTRYVDHLDTKFLVGVVRDITEMKQMQGQLAQSDRLASMGMLAAGVAHEINNPLAYILYNLESLSDDLPKLSSALGRCLERLDERFGQDEWEKLLGADHEFLNPSILRDIQARFEDALQGTKRIKDVARSLGTFSRVEQEKLVAVSLTHVIELAINLVFNEIKYRARLVKDYGKASAVTANDGRLSQVFLNLLINAAHAIPEGDYEGNSIRVRTWQEGNEVFAEISDTGRGISPEHLPHLFEPFFTTKDVGVGTGLGLPISKNIVESYGGRIEVTSMVGKGTSFVVRLPVRAAEDHADGPLERRATEQLGVHGRILVVDDERSIRSVMVRMLRGYTVVEASTGEEARKLLQTDQAFDLILCDLMMPIMSGVELHEWLISTHPALAQLVVFITGGAFSPRARAYLTEVSNIHIEKPFDVAKFKKTVADFVSAHRNGAS